MSATDQLKLHVAMVSETFHPFVGGVAAQIQVSAQALQQRNVRVSVITKQLPGTVAQEEVNGIAVYRIPCDGARAVGSSRFVLGAMRKLWQLRPSLLHAHELLLPTTTVLLANLRLRVPLVVTVHASGPEIGEVARLQRAKFGAARMALLRQQVDTFVAISRVIDGDFSRADIPQSKRRSIPNGIDMQRFSPVDDAQKLAIRASLKVADLPTAVYTGRLSSEKRVLSLMEMWPAVRQQVPDAQLLLVGNGAQAELLKSRATAGVRLVGDQPDVAPWLQAADLFVMPSVSEGFSLSTLEALAVGLPCVATAVGAIPEFISDGVNGLLVQPDDKAALQNRVLQLLTDKQLRTNLAANAREKVKASYAIEQVAQQLEQLYRRLCSQTER